MERVENIVIVGGGVAGLATAVALQRVGIRSLVLERAPDMRNSGAALGLFPNAWRALEALGVAHKLAPSIHQAKTGRIVMVSTGAGGEQIVREEPNKDPAGPRMVRRSSLVETLAEELPPESIRFSSRLVSMRTEVHKDSSETTVLELSDGAVIRAKVVIGCDGANSMVAEWLGLSTPINSGRWGVRAICDVEEGHGFDNEFRQVWTINKRVGLIPLNDKEVYYFFSHPAGPKEKGMGIVKDPELIHDELVKRLAADLPPFYQNILARSTLQTLSWASLIFRAPWDVLLGPTRKGCVTVAGDAFHPLTPELAQGGSQALEDAVVLARCLANALGEAGREDVWSSKRAEEGLKAYIEERRWRAAGVVTASILYQYGHMDGSGWWWPAMKYVRDAVYTNYLFPKMQHAIWFFDCGKLPVPQQ